jgi:hypothetical protein
MCEARWHFRIPKDSLVEDKVIETLEINSASCKQAKLLKNEVCSELEKECVGWIGKYRRDRSFAQDRYFAQQIAKLLKKRKNV